MYVSKQFDEMGMTSLHLKTPELCLTAVKQDGTALNSIPPDRKTPELCLAAVRQNGIALQYVQQTMPNYNEICLAAVRQNGTVLRN